jgi:hypothetical protein
LAHIKLQNEPTFFHFLKLSFLFPKMLSHTQQQQQYDNPFAQREDTFDFYEDRTIEPDVDLTGQSTKKQQPASNPFATLSGSIGSRPVVDNTPEETHASYSGQDTLDEPVSETIVNSRDNV